MILLTLSLSRKAPRVVSGFQGNEVFVKGGKGREGWSLKKKSGPLIGYFVAGVSHYSQQWIKRAMELSRGLPVTG